MPPPSGVDADLESRVSSGESILVAEMRDMMMDVSRIARLQHELRAEIATRHALVMERLEGIEAALLTTRPQRQSLDPIDAITQRHSRPSLATRKSIVSVMNVNIETPNDVANSTMNSPLRPNPFSPSNLGFPRVDSRRSNGQPSPMSSPFDQGPPVPPMPCAAKLSDSGNGVHSSDEVANSENSYISFTQRMEQAERLLEAGNQDRTGRYIILPDSNLRKAVDTLYLTVVLAETCECLISLLWPSAFSTSYNKLLKLLFTVFHLLFMATIARSAILEGCVLVDSSIPAIWRIYVKEWFLFDLVTSIPYDLLVSQPGAASLPRLLHVFRVGSLFTTANPLKAAHGWVTGLQAIFWGMWALNVIGVLFLVIDSDQSEEVMYRGDGHNEVFDKYLKGLYWAAITISSVGYGDIVPGTRWTRLFSIPVILMSVVLLSVTTGRVASSVIRLDAFQQSIDEKKAKLYSLMERYDVPWEVQKEAFSIYPTLLETSLRDYFGILHDLPEFMQEKVILCIKKKVVSQVPIFRGVEEKTLTAIAAVTQQILVAPNERIITAGEMGHEMYFIAQGIVEVLVNNDGQEVCAATLQSGSWFGEIALMKETERTASVRTVTACSCFKLLKEDFVGILKVYPRFAERIQRSVESRLQEMPHSTESHTEHPEEELVLSSIGPEPNDTIARSIKSNKSNKSNKSGKSVKSVSNNKVESMGACSMSSNPLVRWPQSFSPEAPTVTSTKPDYRSSVSDGFHVPDAILNDNSSFYGGRAASPILASMPAIGSFSLDRIVDPSVGVCSPRSNRGYGSPRKARSRLSKSPASPNSPGSE